MVFGYCLWRSTSLHLFDQPPTRNRRRYRHQQAKWIHWTSYRKFLTEGFRRTIRSECLDSLSLSCHTPLTPTAAMLSVYKKKMPSGGFNCASDTSYMEYNQPQGLSGPLIACVADVERGKGIGKKGREGKGEAPFLFPSFVLFSLPLSIPFLRLPRATQASPLIKTSFLRSTLLQTFLLKVELLCRISRISHRSSHPFGVERTKNLMFKRAPSWRPWKSYPISSDNGQNL